MHAFSWFILRFAYCHIDMIFIVKMLPHICSKTSKWFSHWLLLYNIFLSYFTSYSFNAQIQGLGVETQHVWSDNHTNTMRKTLHTRSGQRYIAHTDLLSQCITFKKGDMTTQCCRKWRLWQHDNRPNTKVFQDYRKDEYDYSYIFNHNWINTCRCKMSF